MSMNHIGKGLVLVHTGVSIIALTWAAGLWLQFTDWGWKEPRTDLGHRMPSEYDKRAAAYAQAVKARDAVTIGLQPVQVSLRNAEQHFGDNHLSYVQELKRLKDSQDPNFEVKVIKRNGPIELDVPVIGKPKFDEKVDAIKKSYDAYVEDLKKLGKDIDKEIADIRDLTAKSQDITFQLTARGPDGNLDPNRIGIYAMLEMEKKAQDQAAFEKEYLLPNWARALEEAELFSDRRIRLEETLKRLRQGKTK